MFKKRRTRLEKIDLLLSIMVLKTLDTRKDVYKEKQFKILEDILDCSIIDKYFNHYGLTKTDTKFVNAMIEIYYEIKDKTSNINPDYFDFTLDYQERVSDCFVMHIFVKKKEFDNETKGGGKTE